jgi:hypothetical protein
MVLGEVLDALEVGVKREREQRCWTDATGVEVRAALDAGLLASCSARK